MKKKLVIVGNGTYSAMMKRYIELTGFGMVYAFAVEKNYISESKFCDIPVVSIDKLCECYPIADFQLIMGIGYLKMGSVRKKIYEKCKSLGYKFANYIHPTAIISSNVVIGEGNNILEGVIIEESVCIGNANLFFGGSLIAHETVIGSFNTFSVKSVVAGVVKIKDNCFIGAASTVRDHVILNDYALIGASAYAFKDIPTYGVVVPSPSTILDGEKSIEYF